MISLQEEQIPTLTESESAAISELKGRLNELFTVKEIILFGSKARGDFDRDSDVDLLVVVQEPDHFQNRSLLSDLTFDINLKFNTLLTCILRNQEKWHLGIGEYVSFIEDVHKEGISIEL